MFPVKLLDCKEKKTVRMVLNNAFTKTHGDVKNGDWKLFLLTSYDTQREMFGNNVV